MVLDLAFFVSETFAVSMIRTFAPRGDYLTCSPEHFCNKRFILCPSKSLYELCSYLWKGFGHDGRLPRFLVKTWFIGVKKKEIKP